MAALFFRSGEYQLGKFYYPLEIDMIEGFPYQTPGLKPRRGKFNQQRKGQVPKQSQFELTPSYSTNHQPYRGRRLESPAKQNYKTPRSCLPKLNFHKTQQSVSFSDLKKTSDREYLSASTKPRLRLTYYRISPKWDVEPTEYYSPLWTKTPLHYLSASSVAKNFDSPLLTYQSSAPRTTTLIKYKDPLKYVATRGTARPLPRRRYWLSSPISWDDMSKRAIYSPSKNLCYDDEDMKYTDLLRHATLSSMPAGRANTSISQPKRYW